MAFRYTPTPTPSNTPTTSLTPSITPTITPSSTSCPYICCIPGNLFPTTAGAEPYRMYLCPDDSILVQGFNLISYGGTSVKRTIRIDSCGNLLNVYDTINLAASNGSLGGFATLSDGRIVFGEGRALYRLDTNYNLDTTFNSGLTIPNTGIIGVEVNSQDEIFIVGNFGTNYTTSAGTVSFNSNIYKLDKNGNPISSYSGITLDNLPATSYPIFQELIGKDNDGNIMIWGFQDFCGNANYRGVIRLFDDGSLDTSFITAFNNAGNPLSSDVFSVRQRSDGKYYVGGGFINYSGLTNQDALILLNNDGSLDTSFQYALANIVNFYGRAVWDINLQSTGKLIVCNGNNDVRRFNTDGSIDATFFSATTTSTSTDFFEIGSLILPNDYIYIGGRFDSYASQPFRKMVKLDPNGNLNMCPEPSATPTTTPSPTNTPSLTPTKTPNTTASPTPSITPSQTFVYYIYAGTTNLYATDTLACNNKTCGRPWYKSVPTWSIGTIVYDDSALTTPLVGGNNWIAVSTSTGTYCGGGWGAVQVDNSGVILNFVSCP